MNLFYCSSKKNISLSETGNKNYLLVMLCCVFISAGCSSNPVDSNKGTNLTKKLLPPPNGKIYHAAFPDIGAPEDNVTEEKISSFETLVGKKIAWTYFSDNWFKGEIKFPTETVKLIHKHGSVPFIRLMPRNSYGQEGPDPIFSMQKIIDGVFDAALIQWAKDAKETGIPLLAEFGTECNGAWFGWNAKYNGSSSKTSYGDPAIYDGMERFKDAYRHIIDITKKEGAINITWFYHVNAGSDPQTDWNNLSGYYPGDDYIDWIGISVYGPQTPDENWRSFQEILDGCWNEVSSISKSGKPIAILEWGIIENSVLGNKAKWFSDAFNLIKKGGRYYPYIKAMSYWQSGNLRNNTSSEALEAYKVGISDSIFTGTSLFSNEIN